ncbi:hypothetical protein ACJX0J_026389, partial [Zea mays]
VIIYVLIICLYLLGFRVTCLCLVKLVNLGDMVLVILIYTSLIIFDYYLYIFMYAVDQSWINSVGHASQSVFAHILWHVASIFPCKLMYQSVEDDGAIQFLQVSESTLLYLIIIWHLYILGHCIQQQQKLLMLYNDTILAKCVVVNMIVTHAGTKVWQQLFSLCPPFLYLILAILLACHDYTIYTISEVTI